MDVVMSAAAPYSIEQLAIPSNGERLAARLYRPARPDGEPTPVTVVVGPVAAVKEQSPKQYATRLAARGRASVIFDFRYFGSSTGQPRQFESPEDKVADILAVVDHLRTQPHLGRLSLLAICQGVNWAVEAAVRDPRITRLAIVSGHYLSRTTIEGFFAAMFGDVTVADRIAGGRRAREAYEQTGEVDYIPVVGDATVSDRLLPALPTCQYYSPWATHGPAWNFHGLWENRVTRMSEELLWSNQVDLALSRLATPTLALVANRSATPPHHVEKLFAPCPAPHEIRNLGDIDAHIQFYDDAELIDRATAELVPWLTG